MKMQYPPLPKFYLILAKDFQWYSECFVDFPTKFHRRFFQHQPIQIEIFYLKKEIFCSMSSINFKPNNDYLDDLLANPSCYLII